MSTRSLHIPMIEHAPAVPLEICPTHGEVISVNGCLPERVRARLALQARSVLQEMADCARNAG
jgi:hypothetical protein